ncbi:MAG: LysM peptidoglycan-binding domain-containing protein [Planctomycetes bacterium]|nr:LysM peptidoglycan-binding domain-containing protein [Planctomycetota bacterium]
MPRRISPLSAVIVVLAGCAAFAAYRSGWIPVEFGGTPTGSILDAVSTPDGLDQPPEFEADDSALSDVCGVTGEGNTKRNESLMPDEPLHWNDSAPTAIRRSKWDTLLEEESAADSIGTQPAVFQKASDRTPSRLRFIAEEQPVGAPKKSEPVTAPRASEAEPNTEPAVRVAERSKELESTFDFTAIDRQIKAGQVVEAHKALSRLYWQQPDLRSHVQERIDLTAKAIYFSPQPHIQEPYVVQAGDQLRKIATKHHVSWPYLVRLNRIDPKRLREGQKLKVIDGPFGAVVTLTDFELTLHLGGQYVRSYSCCIGKNNATPTGKFKVLNKVTNPQYTDPDGKVFSGSDPKNPLGTHWIDLGDSYGIHGTIEPDSIGKAESRGCIRLLNADVSEVYDLLETGAEVVIRQ